MGSESLGPRRQALLEAWGEHIATTEAGPGFDFSIENRTAQTQKQVEAFLENPSTEQFESLWTYEVLADSLVGGSQAVLRQWNDNIDGLTERIAAIRDADSYHRRWERSFPKQTAVWELYGRLHPDSAPVLCSECNRGFDLMGLERGASFTAATSAWDEFVKTYDNIVGYATQGTPHEVPRNHEISEFLQFIATQDDETILGELQSDETYRPLSRWRQEGPIESDIEIRGHETHLEGYVTAKKNGAFTDEGPEDMWNGGHWESWKQEYQQHMESVIKQRYNLTDLQADEIESFLDDLNETMSISNPVPSYMLGGRQGGILWSGFKDRSLEDPERTADVLSYLYDENEYIGIGLDRFAELYGTLDEGGGGLLSLATILLTFAYPRKYVFYKWSLMRSFFGDFTEYEVGTGYDTDQYWKLNLACREQLLPVMDREFDEATLLDVHSLLYVYHNKYAEKEE